MTQEEWENATDEQRGEEYERCKDPVYFYNTYWVDNNGNKPRAITKEDWDYLLEMSRETISHRRYNRIYNTTIELKKLPDFIKPKSKL